MRVLKFIKVLKKVVSICLVLYSFIYTGMLYIFDSESEKQLEKMGSLSVVNEDAGTDKLVKAIKSADTHIEALLGASSETFESYFPMFLLLMLYFTLNFIEKRSRSGTSESNTGVRRD